MMRVLLSALLALAACGNGAAPLDLVPIDVETVAVPFDARDSARQGDGRLRYLGGVELRSRLAWFGGFSALRCAGRCHAVGDTGAVVSFDLVERDEWLTGIGNVEGAALLDADGNSGDKQTRDAESLILSPGGAEALVGFERTNSLAVFPLGESRWQASREYRLPEMANWPLNGGPETLVMLPGGQPLVIAEAAIAGTEVPAIIIGGRTGVDGKPANALLRYAPPADFSPTDAVMIDDRRLLILNRAFSLVSGVAMALVEVDVADLGHGALVTGHEIARLRPPVNIDNMEGIEVRRAGDRVFLYLISDNNFNAAQRTLLLKFELLP